MGKTTKKALIYNPYLDTLGGGERYCLTLAECLLSKGWEVDFWWRGEDVLSKAKKRFGLTLKGLRVISPDLRPLFKRLRLTQSYDLIFWLSDGSLPFLLSSNNIVHFQVPFKNTGTNKLLNQTKIKLIDQIVCNSEFTKKSIDKEFGVKSVVLYPPIDVAKFKPGKKEKIILAVGRFEETMQAKKQDVLIKAFKKMVDGGLKDWKLLLVGGSLSEPDKNLFLKKLKKQAKGYPITFLVNSSFHELKGYYAKARIFWHAAGFGVDEEKEPWRVEHFGMTTVEAMAAGCVPVVIDKGGPCEIVRRDEGYRWGSIKELIEKTDLLIKNSGKMKSFSKHSTQSSKKYSKLKFCKQLVRLIK